MKKSDVQEIFKKIKSNYQDFIVDDYKKNEWYNELKNYDVEDVIRKVEEHLRSEEYGKFPPKLYFLTKYLKTTAEKNTKTHFFLQCNFCKEYIPEEEYENHYQRCIDVNYIIKIRKKYFNTEITKEMKQKFMDLSQEQFDIKYLEFLNNIYNDVPAEEQKLIDVIINPPKIKKFDIGVERNEY